MLRTTIFSILAAALLPARAAQVPLGSSQRWPSAHSQGILGHGEDISEWNLYTRPNPNATEHLVFETVHSLLQHWPNTRMRNGHNVVPGSIPKGMLLYHGTSRNELPQEPDWIATDPEHSYLFCRNLVNQPQQGCWHLTLMTTRPLKVVYFDGSSAAKLPYGSLDTQDLIAWGRVGSDVFSDERRRIKDLCAWGRNFDVDGFVRMEMDFEVMLCDFTSGVNVVSFANLVSRPFMPFIPSTQSFEVMNAGSWHNRFPGETRIQLDLSGLVSFYDTKLTPSLVPIRFGQERWDHRVRNVSSEDLATLKSRLEANLIRPEGTSSGIDWRTLVQVIVDRYAERLELTRYLLNVSASDPEDVLDLAKKAQTQLRIMLTPYLLFSATPTDPSDETALEWTVPIYKLCATTHTYAMESQFESMTDSEKLLLRAMRTTTQEICRVVTRMWAAGVYAGIDPLNVKEPDTSEVARLRETWTEELDDLMRWLDWNVWIKCDPGCGREEMCYLPTWPVSFPRHGGGRGPGGGSPPPPPPGSEEPPPYPGLDGLSVVEVRDVVIENLVMEVESVVQPDPDDWVRPQPRCIRRIEPYDI